MPEGLSLGRLCYVLGMYLSQEFPGFAGLPFTLERRHRPTLAGSTWPGRSLSSK